MSPFLSQELHNRSALLLSTTMPGVLTCLSYLPISTHLSPELIRVCFLLLVSYFNAASASNCAELSRRQYYPTSHSLSYTHTHTHTHTHTYIHTQIQSPPPSLPTGATTRLLTKLIWHVSIIFYSTIDSCTSPQRNVNLSASGLTVLTPGTSCFYQYFLFRIQKSIGY